MVNVADANVDVTVAPDRGGYEDDPKAERQITRGQRVLDILALSAGGRAAFMQLHEYGAAKGGSQAAKFNAAIAEAIHGETEAIRHNAHSRAESIIAELKDEYSRKFGSRR